MSLLKSSHAYKPGEILTGSTQFLMHASLLFLYE